MLCLHIGRRYTSISLAPVRQYPGMWRVLWPDGKVSPMGNITRAKEAAIRYARPRGLGGGEVVRWERRETVPETSPAVVLVPEVVG